MGISEIENILFRIRDLQCNMKIIIFEQIQRKLLNEYKDVCTEVGSNTNLENPSVNSINNYSEPYPIEGESLVVKQHNLYTQWTSSLIKYLYHTYNVWCDSQVNLSQNDKNIYRKNEKQYNFTCEECSRTFTRKNTYNIHKKKHSIVENDYGCNTCGFKVHVKSEIIKHVKTHLKHRVFACHLCSKTFVSNTILQNHISVIHQKWNRFHCNKCNYFTYSTHTLKEHIKMKHDEYYAKYACVICETVLHSRSMLKVHLRSHTGEKPYRCDSCSATFICSGHLTNHKNSVHSDKQYACTACDKSFQTIHRLRRHSFIHNRIKPFQCQFCKTYSSATHGNLTRHVKTVHQMPDFSYSKYKKMMHGGTVLKKDSWNKNGELVTKQYLEQLSMKMGQNLTIDQLKEQYLKSKNKEAELTEQFNISYTDNNEKIEQIVGQIEIIAINNNSYN